MVTISPSQYLFIVVLALVVLAVELLIIAFFSAKALFKSQGLKVRSKVFQALIILSCADLIRAIAISIYYLIKVYYFQ